MRAEHPCILKVTTFLVLISPCLLYIIGKTVVSPLAALAALLSLPLLLIEVAGTLPGLGVGFRPAGPLRAGAPAPAGRSCT